MGTIIRSSVISTQTPPVRASMCRRRDRRHRRVRPMEPSMSSMSTALSWRTTCSTSISLRTISTRDCGGPTVPGDSSAGVLSALVSVHVDAVPLACGGARHGWKHDLRSRRGHSRLAHSTRRPIHPWGRFPPMGRQTSDQSDLAVGSTDPDNDPLKYDILFIGPSPTPSWSQAIKPRLRTR